MLWLDAEKTVYNNNLLGFDLFFFVRLMGKIKRLSDWTKSTPYTGECCLKNNMVQKMYAIILN